MILIDWADVDVAKRPGRNRAPKAPFDGEQQARALSKLQDDAGVDATVAAQLVGLSYPQYNRYLWGKLPLRTDQLKAFADAYGVPRATLTRALGLLDDEPDAALLGRCVEALGACGDDATARAVERNLRPLSSSERDEQLGDIRAGVAEHRHS